MKNYVLKITLSDTDISRTVAIPDDFGFFDLHEVICITFGWEDYFFHEFEIGGTSVCDDANEESDLLPEKFRYEYEANLEFFLMNVREFTYIYDIEQPWVHDVTVEGILEEGFDIPVLLECTGKMIVENLLDDDTTEVTFGAPADKDEINLVLKQTYLS